jgi:hypothetical protein
MSLELSLIRRVIDMRAIRPVLEFGITADDFTDQQAKTAWAIVYDWYIQPGTEGSVIELHVFQRFFASTPIVDAYPGTTLEALCYLVRTNRLRSEGSRACVDLTSSMALPNADITGAMGNTVKRLEALIALGQTRNTDINAKQGIERQIQRVREMQAGISYAVAAWPWEPLQRETMGVQPDDYVVLYGRPKNLKTWIASFLIAWFFEWEIKTVVYTKEMTPDNLYQRVAACILRQAYQTFRLGRITEDEISLLQNIVDQMMHDPLLAEKLIVLSGRDVPPGQDTVPWLKSKLDHYNPKIAIVDGLYLLSGDSGKQKDNERVQSISRQLRGIPLDLGIPVIATNQANRAAAKNRDANTDEIAFSDALAQDATLAARVIANRGTPTVDIIIGGSREFRLHGFKINAVPAVDFSLHSELSEEDAEKAKKADADAEDKKGKKSKKKDENPHAVNEVQEISARTEEAVVLRRPVVPS